MSMPWRTPTDELNASHRRFHQIITPQCERFIAEASGKTDDERRAEHFRLTELLMKLILLVDGLVLDLETLKQKRKTLILEAQEIIGKLDACLEFVREE
jgi:hypothetical protein